MGNSCSPGCRLWCLLWRLLCCPFPRWMSWMGSGTKLSQFQRDFLPTLGNPSETDPIKSKISSRHLVGKGTAQKGTIKDTTSDSQVNSNFPYRWSPASLTFNNYFYLFLYLYITRITINNTTPHLKSQKSKNRRAALGRPAIKITWGGGGALTSLRSTNPRSKFCLGSSDKQ